MAVQQNVCWYFLVGLASGLTFTLIVTTSVKHGISPVEQRSAPENQKGWTQNDVAAKAANAATATANAEHEVIKFGDQHYHNGEIHLFFAFTILTNVIYDRFTIKATLKDLILKKQKWSLRQVALKQVVFILVFLNR